MSTVSGKPGVKGLTDGNGEEVRFNSPTDLCIDEKKGVLYIVDMQNGGVRMLDLKTGIQ